MACPSDTYFSRSLWGANPVVIRPLIPAVLLLLAIVIACSNAPAATSGLLQAAPTSTIPAYHRDAFGAGWAIVRGHCDTREIILERDAGTTAVDTDGDGCKDDAPVQVCTPAGFSTLRIQTPITLSPAPTLGIPERGSGPPGSATRSRRTKRICGRSGRRSTAVKVTSPPIVGSHRPGLDGAATRRFTGRRNSAGT